MGESRGAIFLSDLERAFVLSCRDYLTAQTVFQAKYGDLVQDIDALNGDLDKSFLGEFRVSSTRAEITSANIGGAYSEMIEHIALFNRMGALYQLGREFFDGQGLFGEPRVRSFIESERTRVQSGKSVIVKDASFWADLAKGLIKV